MRVFRGFESLPAFGNAVATMGSFDGVHSGHRVLLEQVKRLAFEAGSESIVLTFDPHPRYVLGTDEGMKLLSTLEEKIFLVEQAGIDNLIIIPFTREFSRTSHQDFIRNNIAGIGIGNLVVGYNHRFGHNKGGDFNYLNSCGGNLKITMVEQQQVSSNKVSSTVIRQQIECGNMAFANELLSQPYIIMGERGEDDVLNIDKNKLLPPAGIYSAIINGKQGEIRIENGVLHLNQRVDSDKVLVEVL
jgi:riboflavin kinase/FMN adenylyltransferase